jgi:hypothetical protein
MGNGNLCDGDGGGFVQGGAPPSSSSSRVAVDDVFDSLRRCHVRKIYDPLLLEGSLHLLLYRCNDTKLNALLSMTVSSLMKGYV